MEIKDKDRAMSTVSIGAGFSDFAGIVLDKKVLIRSRDSTANIEILRNGPSVIV
jgi:hypothetical protein